MKHTRQHELDYLNTKQHNRTSQEGQDRARAALAAVYEQIKDPYLERLRTQLIETLRRMEADGATPENYRAYWDIQQKVKTYASSPAVRKRIAARIEKDVTTREAERFWKGGES